MLIHRNCGDSKNCPHEVYETDFPCIERGYGKTKKQAFLNYKNNIEVHIKCLQNYLNLDLKEEYSYYSSENNGREKINDKKNYS